MKERILAIFNSILTENHFKVSDYYSSKGFEVENEDLLPSVPKYIPNDIPFETHALVVNELLLNISDLIKNGKFLDAFDSYTLMIRESAKILKKIDLEDEKYDYFGIYDTDFELVELFYNLSADCRIGITNLLKVYDNGEFAGKLIKWILKEVIRKEYTHHRHYLTLCELFSELSNISINFKRLADDFVLASISPEKEPIEFLKLNYHCFFNDLEGAKKILAAHQMKYELDRFFIKHLHKTGLKYEAIEVAKVSLFSAQAATKGIYKLSLEERAARYNKEDLWNAYNFISWSSRLILDILLELKEYNNAIEYVYYVFTGGEGNDKTLKHLGIDYYMALERNLPKERKGELAKRLFKSLDRLSTYTVRSLCSLENYWLPLLESFKIKSRLYDVLNIYEDCKDQLIVFPEELADMFYSVILNYIEKDSSIKRIEIIKNGLREFSLVPRSESQFLSLLLAIEKKYGHRKALISKLHDFILEENLIEKFEKYKIENIQRSVKNPSFGDLKPKRSNNPDVILKAKETLDNVTYIHDVVRIIDNFDNISDAPDDLRQLIQKAFRETVINYVRNSKKEESFKAERTISALNKYREIIYSDDKLIELILTLQIKHQKKTILNARLIKYISEIGLEKSYNQYKIENAESILEKYNSNSSNLGKANVRKPKKLYWDEKEWSEKKLLELRSLKSIFENKKYLPDDPNDLNENQRQDLFNIYRESIFKYSVKSKKDEETKLRNIKAAIQDLQLLNNKNDSLKILIFELKRTFPMRIKINAMLDEFL